MRSARRTRSKSVLPIVAVLVNSCEVPRVVVDVGFAYVLTSHAEAAALKRKIERAWIERALAAPDWMERDASKPGLVHAFFRIEERNDRVLRVVYNAAVDPVRVVTVYFDRRLRGKP